MADRSEEVTKLLSVVVLQMLEATLAFEQEVEGQLWRANEVSRHHPACSVIPEKLWQSAAPSRKVF
jgi:hypothetical protein